jgi:hypothetical protein
MRVLAQVILLLAPHLALARVCSDPCREAARVDYVECRQDATTAFALGRELCRDRDPACVQACTAREDDCNSATGIGVALEACLGQQTAATADCRSRFPAGSRKREHCIDNARIAGFQCRKRVRAQTAPARRRCRADFAVCANGCGPGEPPRGSRLCALEARRARSAARMECNRTANADKSACANKDAACAEGCREARTTCNAPARSALASAIAACDAERRAAAATCEATNPGGGSALDQCLETADTNAFLCRDAASKAQAPGFAACVEQYAACVRACPAA